MTKGNDRTIILQKLTSFEMSTLYSLVNIYRPSSSISKYLLPNTANFRIEISLAWDFMTLRSSPEKFNDSY